MSHIRRLAASFSIVGLILGLALFCTSLTPSLLPRIFVVQGVLSGVVFAAGYGIGLASRRLWTFRELRNVTGRIVGMPNWTMGVILTLTTLYTLGRMTTWQNSLRGRMEMDPIDSAYPVGVLFVALVTALVVILLGRLLLSGRWAPWSATCPVGSRSSWAARSSWCCSPPLSTGSSSSTPCTRWTSPLP